VPTISTELRFDDVHRQLVAFTELVASEHVEPLIPVLPTEDALRAQLTRLLATIWTNRGLKQPAKKRKAPAPRTPLHGNQPSVFRLIATYHKQRVKCPSQGSLLQWLSSPGPTERVPGIRVRGLGTSGALPAPGERTAGPMAALALAARARRQPSPARRAVHG